MDKYELTAKLPNANMTAFNTAAVPLVYNIIDEDEKRDPDTWGITRDKVEELFLKTPFAVSLGAKAKPGFKRIWDMFIKQAVIQVQKRK